MRSIDNHPTDRPCGRRVKRIATGREECVMSKFRELVTVVEARARGFGVQLSMSKLRDAISIALVNRPYSAAMAAEQAGRLEEPGLPPAHLETACARYRLDRLLFGAAFPPSPAQDAVLDVPRLFLDPVGLKARPPVFTVMLRDEDPIPGKRLYVTMTNMEPAEKAGLFQRAEWSANPGADYLPQLKMLVRERALDFLKSIDERMEENDLPPGRGSPSFVLVTGSALCALDLENYPPEIVARGLEKEYDLLRAERATYPPDDGLRLRLDNLSSGRPAPLYKRYPGQSAPQQAYVELDERGNVTADCSGEIGNAVPARVWHGRTRRFAVSPSVRATALKAYLEGAGRALLAAVHAGHAVDGDGSTKRGQLTDEAREAEEALEAGLAELEEADVWPVEEWLFGANTISQLWKLEPLDDLAASLEKAAASDGVQLDGAVEAALLKAATDAFGGAGAGTLRRNVVRTLVRREEISLLQYAEWVAEFGDGDDVGEAELDRDLPHTSLYIMDSRASSEEIDRGRWAAEASFTASGVSVAQAYIARRLRAEEVPHVAAHAAAWDEAERAAFAEAFKGWYKHPESAVLVLG
jgi:hypothetical protein